MVGEWNVSAEHWWNDTRQGKAEGLGEKPSLVTVCPSQMLRALASNWTWASAVRGWRQSACSMAWLAYCLISEPIKACWLLDVPAALSLKITIFFFSAKCARVFCMVLTVNSYYFLKPYKVIYNCCPCNRNISGYLPVFEDCKLMFPGTCMHLTTHHSFLKLWRFWQERSVWSGI